MRIPQSFIDDLLNRTDIVDIIDKRVRLKKAGKEYMACCPFHSEKTPSFTVSPQKQFYHCFGCGAHGTAIGFLMDYERFEFVEAIEELASTLGLTIPREESSNFPGSKHSSIQDTHSFSKIFHQLERTQDYFQQQLRQHPKAGDAIEYLKKRGVSGEIAKQFGMGFAPPGWNTLSNKETDAEQTDLLMQAGLIISKQNNEYYDRFRNRIMFPIRNRRGRVIAFGGRIVDPEDNPKYLNSPETPVFHKGRELYGLFEAREAVRHPLRLLVVEGYMDVVALAQFKIAYAVATLGTATSSEHLEVLFRVVKEVIFCFDGDAAGRRAATRALEVSLPLMQEGRQVGFLFIPEGHDPDSLVREEGTQQFEQRIDKAMPLSEYLITSVAAQINLDSVDGKSRFIDMIRPFISKLPENVFKTLLISKISEYLQVPISTLEQGLDKTIKSKMLRQPSAKKPRLAKKTLIRQLITILLHYPEFSKNVNNINELKEVRLPGIELFVALLETLKSDPNLNTSALLERWRNKEGEKHLLTLAQLQLPGEKEGLLAEFNDVVEKLMIANQELRWDQLQNKLAQEGLSQAEKLEYQQLLDIIKQQNT